MKQRVRRRTANSGLGRLVFSAPDVDDVIALLRSWRFWLLGGIIGGLLGAAFYAVFPPAYRARATVIVDFHMEQAWPQNTDREQFYYLERETRKLEEIAFSDATLLAVQPGASSIEIARLRQGVLHLGQPGNGGWHFYASDADPDVAVALAIAWAAAFRDQVEGAVASGLEGGPERFITVDLSQGQGIQASRAYADGTSVLAGAAIGLSLTSLAILFLRFRQ